MDRGEAAEVGPVANFRRFYHEAFRGERIALMNSVTAPGDPAFVVERLALDHDKQRGADRSIVVAVGVIAAAMAMMLIIAVWGILRDLSDVRKLRMDAEMSRQRAHAHRTITFMQGELNRIKPPHGNELAALAASPAVRERWERPLPQDRTRLYAALVSPSGDIILHTDPAAEGRNLGQHWADAPLPEAGEDAVRTDDLTLAGGRQALDLHTPVYYEGRVVGYFHSGFNYEQFQRTLEDQQRQATERWLLILGLVVLLVVAAGVSLFVVARRITLFRQAMRLAHVRRLADLGQLMGALAHEIRNPLNAMRLNLHVLERQSSGILAAQGVDETCDSTRLIDETNREIERIDNLIRVLLSYTRPEQPRVEDVDACEELRGIAALVRASFDRAAIDIRIRCDDESAPLRTDRNRFRQVMLNLVNNAKEAIGTSGTIEVVVRRRGEWVEIDVLDDGPGIAPQTRDRIFEPFFTTKELGTGLGLALARRFIEEMGGTISCLSKAEPGACFRIVLPAAQRTVAGLVPDADQAAAAGNLR